MKIKHPLKPQLVPASNHDFYLEDELILENLAAEDFDYSYLSSHNMILRQATLTNVTMQKTRLERFECSNVYFYKCDLSNLEWLGGSFHQVWFDQCKLTGTNFAESYLRDCTFTDCLANLASFSNTNLKSVAFENCELKDTEFYEMTWRNLILQKNKLTGSNWFRTKMQNLDLTTNQFDKIAFSQELLHGLKVNQEQALVIAAGLGLIIE